MLKRIFWVLLISTLAVQAEEPIRVQATPQTVTSPKIQAANLAPIETKTQPQVIELKPQLEVPVKVQATPVVPPAAQSQQPIQEQKPIQIQTPASVQTVPQTPQTNQVQQTQTPTTYKPPVQLTPQQTTNSTNLVTPANINQEACSKMFVTTAENLFILTLGAIEANNFQILELQSKGGFITFKAMNKEFLATIAEIDNKTAMLRINPTNGVYHFAPGIVAKIFEYVGFKLG